MAACTRCKQVSGSDWVWKIRKWWHRECWSKWKAGE
jgi:hypothetical protein